MLRFDITAVVLVACLFNFGDAAVTGWNTPGGITGGGGAATDIAKDENTALNAVIVTFEATGDAAITGYALVSTNTPFSLDTSSGELTLTTALDYETATSHTVEVE
ncbi:uncharacterized protein LOC132733095 [Ruditapes philippinarum]|uniref:uncharacterized protein LOC132733095 n=1 Tax=Ruditapes philippinarum TaxID=129788 RepID=UPI00295AA783|nr:uncharacterized protein LOC132733095 [Ruditapes philippinarum]